MPNKFTFCGFDAIGSEHSMRQFFETWLATREPNFLLKVLQKFLSQVFGKLAEIDIGALPPNCGSQFWLLVSINSREVRMPCL